MTTISFDDIRVGDLVRATDEEPGRIVRDWTFTVSGKEGEGYLRYGPGKWDLFAREGCTTTFALLERPLAGWEAEVVAAEPKPPTLVPGMVVKESATRRVVLPGGDWYNVEDERVYHFGRAPKGDVVFDPRDAPALPSPLGIRVGDTVRREVKGGVTVEFVVNNINDYWIFPAYGTDGKMPGLSYDPKDFTVVSREVPDRLPAGTITRSRDNGVLFLRTQDGHIFLTGALAGRVTANDAPGMDTDVTRGATEVIYLP